MEIYGEWGHTCSSKNVIMNKICKNCHDIFCYYDILHNPEKRDIIHLCKKENMKMRPQARATERMVLHMKSVYIKLNEINDVYALVNTLVSYDGEVDLESGRYKVDGKSLLGIFSLDLRKPVKLTFHDSDKASALLDSLKGFIVENPEA